MHFPEGTFKGAIFSIFTWRALVRNRTLMISCLCNVLFTGLQHDTTLHSLSTLDREISLKNIHTNKHTYIHTYITYMQTWPETIFYRFLYSCFAPSALSLRLNNNTNWTWRLINVMIPKRSYRPRNASFNIYVPWSEWSWKIKSNLVNILKRSFFK